MSSIIDVSSVSDILARHTGLDLGRGGMEARLVSYIQQRLAERPLSFAHYLDDLKTPGSEELRLLSEAMTVVYTWFFRDPGQFALIEGLIRDFPADRTMDIWIAGCATGEEAYSVALVAAQLNQRVAVLGTDINSNALEHARQGRYGAASLNAVDPAMRQRYLDCTGDYGVSEQIKASVRFQKSNLMEAAPQPPRSSGWDLVLCRNVLIYFGKAQARRTLDMLANSLAPGGALVLGASEAIIERPTTLHVAAVAGRAVLVRPKNDGSSNRPSGIRSAATVSVGRAVPLAWPTARSGSASAATLMTQSTRSSNVDTNARRLEPNHKVQRPVQRAGDAIEAGHKSLEAGDVPSALSHYLLATTLDPTCPDALMHAGIAHYLQGSFAEALFQLRGALCLDAKLWPAHFFQALAYDNMGYAEDAARSYAQVVRLNKGHEAGVNEHPFLKGWRNDLLAVAHNRASPNPSTKDRNDRRTKRES